MADIYVEMSKDGKTIVVHPGTLENHKQLGWMVVKEGVSEKGAKPKGGHGAKNEPEVPAEEPVEKAAE